MELNYIPVFKKNEIDNIILKENVGFVRLKNFAGIGEVTINRTTKLILDSCTGKNNLSDIIEIIKNTFDVKNEQHVKEDLYNILSLFENLELINWIDENPFEKMKIKKFGDYEAQILTTEEIGKSSLQKGVFNPKYPHYYSNDLNVFKNQNLSKYGYTALIKYKKENILLFNITIKSQTHKSLDFCILDFDFHDDLDFSIVQKLLEWTITNYSRKLRTNFLRIDTIHFSTENEKVNDFLSNLNFKFKNILKAQYRIQEDLKDVYYYSKLVD